MRPSALLHKPIKLGANSLRQTVSVMSKVRTKRQTASILRAGDQDMTHHRIKTNNSRYPQTLFHCPPLCPESLPSGHQPNACLNLTTLTFWKSSPNSIITVHHPKCFSNDRVGCNAVVSSAHILCIYVCTSSWFKWRLLHWRLMICKQAVFGLWSCKVHVDRWWTMVTSQVEIGRRTFRSVSIGMCAVRLRRSRLPGLFGPVKALCSILPSCSQQHREQKRQLNWFLLVIFSCSLLTVEVTCSYLFYRSLF